MVSYYNPLSPAMFPNPPNMGVARHSSGTPSAASAASVAAGHAYFQNYHAHVAAAAYGHAGHAAAHQYAGGYASAANLAADLNSNMYNGGQNGQFMDNTWSTAAGSPHWPGFGHPPISSAGACRFDSWPQQNSTEDSPPTPTNNESATSGAGAPPSGGRSPGNYTQSHSSGSPSATPTPAQSYHQPEMFNKFNSNFGGHSPVGAGGGLQGNLDSSSPLNPQHCGDLNPMASPVASLASPTSRPQPARSPYEWMKKPSYQSQPEKQGENTCTFYISNAACELEKVRKM